MFQSIKIIIKSIFSLHIKTIFRLLGVTVKHPWLSIMGFYGTLKAYSLASKYFPKDHEKNGKANAFRHAIWTGLVANYCCKITSPQKAIEFSKKLTDLHEDLFPNPPLLRAMDLHNNKIGLLVFRKIIEGVHRQFVEKSFIIEAVFEKLSHAKFVSEKEEITGNELIYIEKEKSS